MAEPSDSDRPAERQRTRISRNATCLACGCLCDDITLHVAENRIVRAERACPIGERWFLAERPTDRTPCLIHGQRADLDEACDLAAAILAKASCPLIFGLGGAVCEAHRIAVALADLLGGIVIAGNEAGAALATAEQSVGFVTATLGEVRHRADLVVYWGVDPATTHPRHFERYCLTCAGRFIPGGRADRTCVVVDSRRTPTAAEADLFLELKPGSDVAAIAALLALAAGESTVDAEQIALLTGVELSRWRELLDRMAAARYGAMFFDPLSLGGEKTATIEAILSFVVAMNRRTRFVALTLGGPGNMAGAEQVLAWQTGYPTSIRFRDGFPRSEGQPGAISECLLDGQVDAALVVASEPVTDPLATLSEPAREQLAAIPTIVLHTADAPLPFAATVAFVVGSHGIDAGGTVFRCDGVPLPLHQALTSPYPAATRILQTILASMAASLHATTNENGLQ